MIEVREYLDRAGHSRFVEWFDDLNPQAAAKVTIAIARMTLGNFSNVKGIGAGVYEYRLEFGPGYRIYFGKDGEHVVILLGGGNKARQQKDIDAALGYGRTTNRGKSRRHLMALTRDFKETIQARVQRDRVFRKELLRESMECLLSGDLETGKIMLRDIINATVGFSKLAEATGHSPKSLMRMLGPNGNPTARNLFDIVAYLQQAEGVCFQVRATRAVA